MPPFKDQVLGIIGLLRHKTLKRENVVAFKIQKSCENFTISHSVPWFLSGYFNFLLFFKATQHFQIPIQSGMLD